MRIKNRTLTHIHSHVHQYWLKQLYIYSELINAKYFLLMNIYGDFFSFFFFFFFYVLLFFSYQFFFQVVQFSVTLFLPPPLLPSTPLSLPQTNSFSLPISFSSSILNFFFSLSKRYHAQIIKISFYERAHILVLRRER